MSRLEENIYQGFFRPFIRQLRRNEQVEITRRVLQSPNASVLAKWKSELLPELSVFYEWTNGLEVQWKPRVSENPDEIGVVNILPIESLFGNTVLTLDSQEIQVNSDYVIVDCVFRHVDYFVNEASVGFFSDPKLKRSVYLRKGFSFYDLKLDFEGYFKLLCHAFGYYYWQDVLVYLEYGEGKFQYDEFKENVPKVFPDFDFDKFIELYESLKFK